MRYDRARQLEDGRWLFELVEVPDWALGLRWLLEEVDHRSGHVLCGQGIPDRFGLRHLAGWLYQGFGYILFLPEYQERVLVTSDPIDARSAWAAMVVAATDPRY